MEERGGSLRGRNSGCERMERGLGGDVTAKVATMRALDQLATAVEMRLAKFFRRVGYFVADRPYSCIIGSILLAAVLSAGAVTIKSESRARELYAPSGNRGQKDLDLASGLFAAVEPEKRHNRYHDIRSSSRGVRVPENGRDLYTREVLNSLYALITDLKKVTAEHNDETFSFQDVCPKSVQKGFENQCQVPRADLRPS
eukprot:3224856-Rhodomonas_salina.1